MEVGHPLAHRNRGIAEVHNNIICCIVLLYCSGLVPVIKYVNTKGFKLGLVSVIKWLKS